MKILDLFSGTQSVRKALDTMNVEYEYYGIDIYSPEEENIILDLSQDDIVQRVIEVLPKDWKPDFIWASPVCNKFSLATAMRGGNLYFEKTKQGVKVRQNFSGIENTVFKNMDIEQIQKEAAYHLNLVSNMQKVIDYYDCNFIIENPATSYIKNFLNPLYIMNRADYCMYGFDYKKPTTLYSNYVLNLKTCNHKQHDRKIGSRTTKQKYGETQGKVNRYQQRASVPPKLVKQILTIFLGNNQ